MILPPTLATMRRLPLWAVFLVTFFVSRLLLAAAGVGPVAGLVLAHWQNLDVGLLASDPWGALANLQSQPPIWNAVLAAAIAISGQDAGAISLTIHIAWIALSACAGLMLLDAARRLGAKPRLAFALGLLAVCSPSTLYYENLIHYPHLTFFLVAALVWLTVRAIEPGGGVAFWGALATLTLLACTWAVFHPAFVGFYAGGLALCRWRATGLSSARRALAMLAPAVFATALAAAPTAHNAMRFGLPSASGWIGLNLAQTATHLAAAERRHCDFALAWGDAARNAPARPDLHPALSAATKAGGEPNLNHWTMLERSRDCLALARGDMAAHPFDWAAGRVAAMVRSHQLMPWDYDFDPDGWTSAMAPVLKLQTAAGPLAPIATLGWHLFMWAWLVRAMMVGPRRDINLLLALLIGFFTLATHLANGAEQERMRYTVLPAYLLVTAQIAVAIASRRRSRPPAPSGWTLIEPAGEPQTP